ncbi:hypothetical protein ACFL6R_01940 [Gemmatimonadota bacterium]
MSEAVVPATGDSPPESSTDRTQEEKEETRKPPAKEEAKKPPAKEEAKKPPAKEETKKPPAKEEAKKPPAKEETKKPPAKEEAKKPPAKEKPRTKEEIEEDQAKEAARSHSVEIMNQINSIGIASPHRSGMRQKDQYLYEGFLIVMTSGDNVKADFISADEVNCTAIVGSKYPSPSDETIKIPLEDITSVY